MTSNVCRPAKPVPTNSPGRDCRTRAATHRYRQSRRLPRRQYQLPRRQRLQLGIRLLFRHLVPRLLDRRAEKLKKVWPIIGLHSRRSATRNALEHSGIRAWLRGASPVARWLRGCGGGRVGGVRSRSRRWRAIG